MRGSDPSRDREGAVAPRNAARKLHPHRYDIRIQLFNTRWWKAGRPPPAIRRELPEPQRSREPGAAAYGEAYADYVTEDLEIALIVLLHIARKSLVDSFLRT